MNLSDKCSQCDGSCMGSTGRSDATCPLWASSSLPSGGADPSMCEQREGFVSTSVQ